MLLVVVLVEVLTPRFHPRSENEPCRPWACGCLSSRQTHHHRYKWTGHRQRQYLPFDNVFHKLRRFYDQSTDKRVKEKDQSAEEKATLCWNTSQKTAMLRWRLSLIAAFVFTSLNLTSPVTLMFNFSMFMISWSSPSGWARKQSRSYLTTSRFSPSSLLWLYC